MPNQHGSHRFGKRHVRREIKGIREHDLLEALIALREQQVAHHDDPKELLLLVCDKAVRDNGFAG